MLSQALTCGRGATVSTFTRIPGGPWREDVGRGGGETAERMSVRRPCCSSRVADVSSAPAKLCHSPAQTRPPPRPLPSLSPPRRVRPPARSRRCFLSSACSRCTLAWPSVPRSNQATMANYNYDEAGNMAAYFVLTFLTIFLVPYTLASLAASSMS